MNPVDPVLPLGFLTLVLASALAAQQPEPKPEPPTPTSKLASVLERAAQGPLLLSGRVLREEADSGDFGGGMVVVGATQDSRPFVGKVEVWQPRAGEILIASQHLLPGVVVYEIDEDRVVQTTFADEPVSAAELGGDLTALANLGRLVRALDRAHVAATNDEQTGAVTYTCKLPKRYLREAGGLAQMFQPKVLAVKAVVGVDAQHRLASLRFEVQRSDPTAAMREQAMAGGFTGGALTLDELEQGDAQVGVTTIYELSLATTEPGARTVAALEAMRRALASEPR